MTVINLEGGCRIGDQCSPLATKTFGQLGNGRYEWPASVFSVPETLEKWLSEHRTARKRANGATRAGYVFQPVDRTRFEEDVYKINTSTSVRQGRPMTDGYTQRVHFSPLPAYTCRRHAINTYGVLSQGHLVAYTWVYRVGELVMFSQILGHHAHLEQNVMYLLVAGVVAAEIRNGHGVFFYNMHDSGTDGLRFFKERCGFRPDRLEWRL